VSGYKRNLGPCRKRTPTCPAGSHDRWELIVSLGRDPLTGKYPQKSETFHGSDRQADKRLARLTTEVDDGKHKGALSTVAQIVDRWLAERREHLSPYTVRRYKSIIDHHILPALGATRAAKVRPAELTDFYTQLRDRKKLGKSSINQTHAILSGAFGLAVAYGWLPDNPAIKAKRPKADEKVVNEPPIEDVKKGLLAAVEYSAEFGVLFWVALVTGARRGELAALRWTDFPADYTQVHISRSLYGLTLDGNKILEEGPTKTHADRVLALDPATAHLLEEHHDRMRERAAKALHVLPHDAFLFSDAVDCTRPWHPDSISTMIERSRKRAGINLHLHQLRHYSVTYQVSEGWDPVAVASRHGHKDPNMTLRRYAHALKARDQLLAAQIGSHMQALSAATATED
jgi:integrase